MSMRLFLPLITAVVIFALATSTFAAPARGEDLHRLARTAFDKCDYKEVCRLADLSIKARADDGEAYRMRALAMGKLEQFASARKDLAMAIKINPKLQDAFTYQLQAECFIDQDNFAAAVKPMKMAASIYPDASKYKLLGQIYCQLNRFAEARECYGMGIKLAPQNPWPYIERGNLETRLNHYQEAIADYSVVIKNSPREPIGYNLRARVYDKMGRKDLAAKDHAHSIALSSASETGVKFDLK